MKRNFAMVNKSNSPPPGPENGGPDGGKPVRAQAAMANDQGQALAHCRVSHRPWSISTRGDSVMARFTTAPLSAPAPLPGVHVAKGSLR